MAPMASMAPTAPMDLELEKHRGVLIAALPTAAGGAEHSGHQGLGRCMDCMGYDATPLVTVKSGRKAS